MECVLYERECTECGECERCDIHPGKRCDNCCMCIESQTDFVGLRVDAVVDAETYFAEALEAEAELLQDDQDELDDGIIYTSGAAEETDAYWDDEEDDDEDNDAMNMDDDDEL